MTDSADLLSPADNWYYRLHPGLHPITPPTSLEISSAIWLGNPQGLDQCTLQLHFFDDSSLDTDAAQSSTLPNDEGKLRKEIIATFLGSISETPLNFILEGQQSYIFELISQTNQMTKDGCEIVLFGRYLRSINAGSSAYNCVDNSLSDPAEKIQSTEPLEEETIGIVSTICDCTDILPRGIAESSQSDKLIGIDIQDDLLGRGDAVQMGSKVTVWYSAKIVETGYIYEDVNVSNGEPAMFIVGSGDVIQGWEEGIIGMCAGGLRTMTISPEKAYGTEGKGSAIPPNSTIEIKCALVGIF